MPKITFIGAGSCVFTRNLLADTLQFPELAGSEIALMDIDPERTSLYFGDVKIVENGEPLELDPDAARRPMLEKDLMITVDLGIGTENATAFTCDFSYDYVKINAEYHT